MSPFRLFPVAAVAATGLALAACGTGGSDKSSNSNQGGSIKAGPGIDVANKTIRIADINALTGPASALGKPVAAGHRAFFKQLNAKGGIDGWKIRLTIKDSGYAPQQHVQLFNAVKGDVAMVDSFGSPTTKAIQPLVDRASLVTLPLSFDSIWGKDPLMAPVGTPYSIDIANALDYYTKSGATKPKIGIIYQDDEYGADGLRGFKAAQKALGFKDAGEETYKAGDTDYTAQVQKLKAAGAKAVVVTALPSSTGPIVGTAATLGFAPQWILQGPAFLEQLITKDGSVAGDPTPVAAALKGAIVTTFAAPWGSSVPGMAAVVAAHDKYEPSAPPSIYFEVAYAQSQLVTGILSKAISDGDLSRAGIAKAKANLGTVDLGGVAPSVTYTPAGGAPSKASIIARIDPQTNGFLKAVDQSHTSKVGDAIAATLGVK